MSWYMHSPAQQHRGIKVDGYASMQRPNLNLSWGMDHRQYMHTLDVKENKESAPRKQITYNENVSETKVMTETSDGEEELMKLLKSRKVAENDRQPSNQYTNVLKNRGRNSQAIQKDQNYYIKQKGIKENEFSKKMRYLQNSLLPHCRQDNMNTIFDHNLCKQVPLGESRMSKDTTLHQKHEGKLKLGNDYNAFSPVKQMQKDLTQQLKEMYEYEQRYRDRMERNHLKLG